MFNSHTNGARIAASQKLFWGEDEAEWQTEEEENSAEFQSRTADVAYKREKKAKEKLTRAEKENEFQNNGTLKKESRRLEFGGERHNGTSEKDTRCRRGNKFHHKHESA